jgi:cell division protein FtsW (lipid II flippase)
MLNQLRRVRFIELQLLITALLFFGSGYLLTSATQPGSEFTRTAQGLLTLLWPSSLPILLFVVISLILSWRAPRADQVLLPLVAVLSGLGLLVIARLQASFDAQGLTDYYGAVAAKQTVFVTAGVALLLLMVLAPLDRIFIRLQHMSLMDWLKNHRWTWVVVGVLLVAVTFVFGEGPEGQDQKLWINFGFFTFQPSELLKLALVIFLASYLDEHREVVARGWQVGPLTLPPLPHLVPMVGMWGLTMGIIVATGKGSYAVVGLLAFSVGAYGMYQVIGRVQDRVAIWLNPWADAPGTGYQIVQSQYALAAGGIFGAGLGQGSPAVVPAVHTDFVFTAIAEELGLAGAIGVLLLYMLLMYRGYHIALRLTSRFRGFEQLLAIGLTSIIAIQTFIIVAGNLRVIPLTGITLPFISYGGSSVLINFLIIGLLLRISAGRTT